MTPKNICWFLLLFISPVAAACSCASEGGSTENAIKKHWAESTFVGVVETLSVHNAKDDKNSLTVDLAVRHVFKGLIAGDKHLGAHIPRLKSSCAVTVRAGQLLLIYASDLDHIQLTFCGPSGDLIALFDELPTLFRISGENP